MVVLLSVVDGLVEWCGVMISACCFVEMMEILGDVDVRERMKDCCALAGCVVTTRHVWKS